MTEYIKVPIERIAVLVGPNGSTKELIEEKSQLPRSISIVKAGVWRYRILKTH
jgi:rRNA processing protein Krr1/Pno1